MLPDSTTISLLFPEIILIAMATFIFVAGAFRPEPRWWPILGVVTYIVTLFVALLGIEWQLWAALMERHVVVSGPLNLDFLGQLARPLALLLGLLLSQTMLRSAPRGLASESAGTLMLAIAGVMFVARANDLVLLFVGLELISIPTYILLFLGRRDRATGEATVKYFFLSLLSSGLLLYGISFLYGMAGTTTLVGTSAELGIREALASLRTVADGQSNLWSLAPVAIVLIFAGLGFKLAAVPFHFYAPDVYQGATPGNAALLAILPKVAGVTALARLLVAMFPGVSLAWQMVVIVALLTMSLGNICALWQRHVRRLLAYSSIAHSGYLLIGIAVALGAGSESLRSAGLAATLFYLAAYAVASLATFATLTYLGESGQRVENVADLAGLGRTDPLAAGILAVSMFSFAGIPVFAGFWGKFALFSSALDVAMTAGSGPLRVWFLTLAVVGALNAAIGAAYYLKIVGVMFFQPATAPAPAGKGGTGALAAMVTCGVLVVGVGVLPKLAFRGAGLAAQPFPANQAAAGQAAGQPAEETVGETVGVTTGAGVDRSL